MEENRTLDLVSGASSFWTKTLHREGLEKHKDDDDGKDSGLERKTRCVSAATRHIVDLYRRISPTFSYSVANNPRRCLTKDGKACQNRGRDNKSSDLVIFVNDVLTDTDRAGPRYRVLGSLGRGIFGQVVACKNLSSKQFVAIKVIKNQPAYYNQAIIETRVLTELNIRRRGTATRGLPGYASIVEMLGHFTHHDHLCIVFEKLDVSLFDVLKSRKFRGFSLDTVRSVAIQLLQALNVLEHAGIIHCDLKPENVLLLTPFREGDAGGHVPIKLCDFGSACYEHCSMPSYIQSRFYRAPEALLGLSYNASLDLWSLGCVLVETFHGLPLFPGSSEYDQVCKIVDAIGPMPQSMLRRGTKTNQYYDCHSKGHDGVLFVLRRSESSSEKEQLSRCNKTKLRQRRESLTTKILNVENASKRSRASADVTRSVHAFAHFAKGLLEIDPDVRWNAREALQHPFISDKSFDGTFVPNSSPIRLNRKDARNSGGAFASPVSPVSMYGSHSSHGLIMTPSPHVVPRSFEAYYRQHHHMQPPPLFLPNSPFFGSYNHMMMSPPITPMMSPPITPMADNRSSTHFHAPYTPAYAQQFVRHIHQQQFMRQQQHSLFGTSAPQRLMFASRQSHEDVDVSSASQTADMRRQRVTSPSKSEHRMSSALSKALSGTTQTTSALSCEEDKTQIVKKMRMRREKSSGPRSRPLSIAKDPSKYRDRTALMSSSWQPGGSKGIGHRR